MSDGEGGKYSRFLTRKEKWMLGVYTAAAVTSTIIFVVTLSLIAQLHNQNETQDFHNKMTNLENKLLQNQNETKDYQYKIANLENKLLQNQNETKDFQNKITNLETKLLQNQNETQDYQNKIANLENKLEEANGKSNTRYHEMLAIGGWTKLSNGLHYKYFYQSTEISFATASEKCEIQGARLASTGIRNATIRREMSTLLPEYRTWIGLTRPYDNSTWVWSDGKLYENADVPWRWKARSCSTNDGLHGGIIIGSSFASLNCYSSTDTLVRYICEV